MAHTLQDRYSDLIDKKLQATLVTKDNYIFNNHYEGNAVGGKVKIPVRSTRSEEHTSELQSPFRAAQPHTLT